MADKKRRFLGVGAKGDIENPKAKAEPKPEPKAEAKDDSETTDETEAKAVFGQARKGS